MLPREKAYAKSGSGPHLSRLIEASMNADLLLRDLSAEMPRFRSGKAGKGGALVRKRATVTPGRALPVTFRAGPVPKAPSRSNRPVDDHEN